MTPEITLYEFKHSRSKQVRWTLLELGLEFESIEGLEVLHSDELKKVNPMGKVPAVVIDGVPLFEAAAICTYLADLVPGKGLIAPSGTSERALHLQWVSFALTEMELKQLPALSLMQLHEMSIPIRILDGKLCYQFF